MNNLEITVVGNLTDDPELREASGSPVAGFTVAYTPRKKEGDEWVDDEPQFWKVSAWRRLGENVAASLAKGDRVIVHGRVKANAWEDKHQQKRRDYQIEADEVAPSLAFATAQPTRNPKTEGRGTPAPRKQSTPKAAYEPSEAPW